MVDNYDFGPTGGKEVVYDEGDKSNIRTVLVDQKDSGTVSGMSCTSGLTKEISQMFKRRKSKRAGKTKTRSDGLPELSEEYDIQTVVSGLTRNSEFPEIRDPPVSPDHIVDDGIDDGIDQASEWPDDETVGQKSHHVISIMDGDQLMSKSTVRSPAKENRVSRFRKEKREQEMLHNRSRSHQKNRLSEFRKERRDEEMLKSLIRSHQKSPSPDIRKKKRDEEMLKRQRLLRSTPQKKRGSDSRKEKRAPLPEPKEMRLEMQPKETPSSKGNETSREDPKSSKGNTISREDPKSANEIMLSPEPDGVKFRNGSQKVAIEPSGMKIEALIYGCAVKNENLKTTTKDKPRRITPTVYMNDDDVEVVYKEKDPDLSEKSEGNFFRRRSKSSNARRSPQDTRYPIKNSNEKQNDHRRQGRSRSVDAKKRSRSLPRTLRRISSRYRKPVESKRDPSPSKRTSYSTDLHSIDPNFIDEIFSAADNRTVSTLGSQCGGIESLVSKIQEMKNESDNYSPPKFSPYSRQEVFPSHPCEIESNVSEPRVCVEFGAKQVGAFFNTTSYANENSSDQTNFEKHNRVDNPRHYSRKEANVPENAPKPAYPGFERTPAPDKFSKNIKRDKVQIDAIAAEASRNLLLSPNGEDDSHSESVNLFERSRSAPNSNLNRRRGNTESGRNISSHVSATPTREKELRQEFLGHESRSYLDEPSISRLSMTPSGRKDLIQNYLALREQHNKLGTGVSSNQSVVSGYSIGTNSIAQSSSVARKKKVRQKGGYDDASKHYRVAKSDEWPFCDAFGRNSEERSAQTFTDTSASKARLRRSNSEGRNMNRGTENLLHVPNKYKQRTNEGFRSPSNVTSFPFSQEVQEKLSYSYASDDDSYAFDGYRSNATSPYEFNAKSNYEEELGPHNQFMKMQIGLGNQ